MFFRIIIPKLYVFFGIRVLKRQKCHIFIRILFSNSLSLNPYILLYWEGKVIKNHAACHLSFCHILLCKLHGHNS